VPRPLPTERLSVIQITQSACAYSVAQAAAYPPAHGGTLAELGRTMRQHPHGMRVVLLRARPTEDGGILRAGTAGRATLLDDGSGEAWFTVWTGQRALVSTGDLQVFVPELDGDETSAGAD
jgi:hypothetical protein